MADLADVEDALLAEVTAVLYPDGASQESILGVLCQIYRGWPEASMLNASLSAGNVVVTIFPDGSPTRNTTRYEPQWRYQSNAVTLTEMVSGQSVTFAGTAAVGQIAALEIDGAAFSYSIVTGDTPASVAANLALAIQRIRIANLSGASIAVPGAAKFVARVVAAARAIQEARRQIQGIRVSCWCPTPALRDQAAALIDNAMASIVFLPLQDQSLAHIIYSGTHVMDQTQNVLLYRRDLLYLAEYPTIVTELQPAMAVGNLIINAADFVA